MDEHGLDLDCEAWQAMLERENIPPADAFVGVLSKADFAANRGRLLVWRGTSEGAQVALRQYSGEHGADVAVLLAGDDAALRLLLARGLREVAALVRRGNLQAYMLKSMDELEHAGLADFVEDMGLVFPKH